jgi:hypothetical protein
MKLSQIVTSSTSQIWVQKRNNGWEITIFGSVQEPTKKTYQQFDMDIEPNNISIGRPADYWEWQYPDFKVCIRYSIF